MLTDTEPIGRMPMSDEAKGCVLTVALCLMVGCLAGAVWSYTSPRARLRRLDREISGLEEQASRLRRSIETTKVEFHRREFPPELEESLSSVERRLLEARRQRSTLRRELDREESPDYVPERE